MLKKRFVFFGAVLLSAFFLLMNERQCEAKPITLIFNNTWPATHHFAKYAFEPWKKEVEEKTGGRVKVEIYHGGILGKMTTTIEDTAAGKYHVAINVPSYKYEKHILPVIGECPFSFPSIEAGYRVINALVAKYPDIIQKEFNEVELMGFTVTDPYILWSRTPIRKMEDLKGKMVSLKSKTFKETIKAWGSTPVSVATPEAYTALQRGTIDILTYSQIGGCSYKFYEVGYYVTKTDMWNFVICGIMNKKFFNSLPMDLQKLFKEELNPSLLKRITYDDYGVQMPAYFKEIKEKAKEVIYLSPAEKKKMVSSGKPAWDYWLNKARSLGLPAEQIMEDYKKLLRKEGSIIPF